MSSSAQDNLYPTQFEGVYEKDLLWLWEKQELNTSYCEEDNSFHTCGEYDNEYSWLDNVKQGLVVAETVQPIVKDVPKWTWELKASDNEDIDQPETTKEEIATQDIYMGTGYQVLLTSSLT